MSDDFDSFDTFNEDDLNEIDLIASKRTPSATTSIPSAAAARSRPVTNSLHKTALAGSSYANRPSTKPVASTSAATVASGSGGASASRANVVHLPDSDDDEFDDDISYLSQSTLERIDSVASDRLGRAKSTSSLGMCNVNANASSRFQPASNAVASSSRVGPSTAFKRTTSINNTRQMNLFGDVIDPDPEEDLGGSGLVRKEGKTWDRTKYAATGYKVRVKPKTFAGEDEEEEDDGLGEDEEGMEEGFEQFPAPCAKRESRLFWALNGRE